jgi:hypothetical protein
MSAAVPLGNSSGHRSTLNREMKPKFELDGSDEACSSAHCIDPDAFDASEQQFAASLEQPCAPAKVDFILDTTEDSGQHVASSELAAKDLEVETGQTPEDLVADRIVTSGTRQDSSVDSVEAGGRESLAIPHCN